jgi:hypothetical protein
LQAAAGGKKARTGKFFKGRGGWQLRRGARADLEKSSREVVDGFKKM